MECSTCGVRGTKALGEGNHYCPHCGTLTSGAMPGFTPEVIVPEVLQDVQEWRREYMRPAISEFVSIMRGVGNGPDS